MLFCTQGYRLQRRYVADEAGETRKGSGSRMDRSERLTNWYGRWIPREEDVGAGGIRNTLTKVRVGAGGPAPGHQSGSGRQPPSLRGSRASAHARETG